MKTIGTECLDCKGIALRAKVKFHIYVEKKLPNVCWFIENIYLCNRNRGNSSVGRAQPCQGWGREFESRFPLLMIV